MIFAGKTTKKRRRISHGVFFEIKNVSADLKFSK